jgi:hypothetical protein
MAEKSKEIKASRLADMGVDPSTISRLKDLIEAGREMRLGRVLSEALEMFIKNETSENEGIRKRFDELQKQRRSENNPGIRVVPKGSAEN